MDRELADECLRALSRGDEHMPQAFHSDSDWYSLWQVREHLVDRAIAAAEHRGRSYRDFRVGAAAFLSSTQPELMKSLGRPPQHIYTGANWKLGSEERNTCAEQEIVSQIRQQHHIFPAREVLALVIAGQPLNEPDRESGLVTETLHPCNHCRKLLSSTPEVQPWTIVITVNICDGKREIRPFSDLLRLHWQPCLPHLFDGGAQK